MSSPGPKFIGLVGFPEEGEYVPTTGPVEAILIRQGWKKPEEDWFEKATLIQARFAGTHQVDA